MFLKVQKSSNLVSEKNCMTNSIPYIGLGLGLGLKDVALALALCSMALLTSL